MVRLAAVAASRFATCINTLDLELRLDLPASLMSKDVQELANEAIPCRLVDACFSPVYQLLVLTFKHTINLKSLIIRPPSDGSFQKFASLNHSELLETPIHQALGGFEERDLSHGYVQGYHSPRTLYHSVFAAINFTKLKLDRLELPSASVDMIQHFFVPTLHLYRSLAVHHPWMRGVSSLTLRLDIFPVNPSDAAAALDKILENSVNLEELDLNLGPTYRAFATDAERKAICHQLMRTLGGPPQFRLRKLSLSGLYADSSVTMKRIVYVHATHFRTLILIDAQFDDPGTMPSLFDNLAVSQVDRLILQRMRIGTRMLIEYAHRILKDDDSACLTWYDGMDLGYKDWVEVAWSGADHEIVYDIRTMPGGPSQFQSCMRYISVQLAGMLS
jgi:hypothetical protein